MFLQCHVASLIGTKMYVLKIVNLKQFILIYMHLSFYTMFTLVCIIW